MSKILRFRDISSGIIPTLEVGILKAGEVAAGIGIRRDGNISDVVSMVMDSAMLGGNLDLEFDRQINLPTTPVTPEEPTDPEEPVEPPWVELTNAGGVASRVVASIDATVLAFIGTDGMVRYSSDMGETWIDTGLVMTQPNNADICIKPDGHYSFVVDGTGIVYRLWYTDGYHSEITYPGFRHPAGKIRCDMNQYDQYVGTTVNVLNSTIWVMNASTVRQLNASNMGIDRCSDIVLTDYELMVTPYAGNPIKCTTTLLNTWNDPSVGWNNLDLGFNGTPKYINTNYDDGGFTINSRFGGQWISDDYGESLEPLDVAPFNNSDQIAHLAIDQYNTNIWLAINNDKLYSFDLNAGPGSMIFHDDVGTHATWQGITIGRGNLYTHMYVVADNRLYRRLINQS